MDLSKILSISGRSGLFKVISQGKNAVIVESLVDRKRFPAFGNERMSSLEEISLFTTGEDRPLKDVLKSFFDKLEGKPASDPRTGDPELLKAFAEIVPDYDPDRVYVSDIRKIFAWYNLLLENQMLDFTEEKAPEEDVVKEQDSERPEPAPEKKEPKKTVGQKAGKASA